MDRRTFLRNSALGGATLLLLGNSRSARTYAANEKLDVALVGVWGRGRWFVQTLPNMENLVALCDVNDRSFATAYKFLEDTAKKFKTSEHSWEQRHAANYRRLLAAKPKQFHDFRKMLDEMGEQIDAVVVSTPDHTHAVASAAAIKAGKHVFCEKPLTRTVHESRALRELARTHKVATSMGNQGTASGQFRRAIELIRDGTLGEIKEVYVWNSGGGSDRKEPPKGSQPVPDHLKWDLWLGPAADRPYNPLWMQRHLWREFGTRQLGNWAPHTANLAFMALKVHELWLAAPTKEPKPVIHVEAKTSGINRLSFPRWEIVTWSIPKRAEFPPITFTWHSGPTPGIRELLEPVMKDGTEKQRGGWRFAGTLIVGTKGTIHSTGHNATFRLLPRGKWKGVEKDRPKTLDRSRGHERDWLLACRGGKPAWANFDYAGALNEFLMLGNVATQFEGRLDFEPVEMTIVNNAEADALLRCDYRKGWEL